MEKQWKTAKQVSKKLIESFPEYNPIVLQLLYNRGIKEEKEIEKFLNPDWERDLYSPFLMKGMKEAISRIRKALKNKEKVAVFGHFDVDGVTSAAVVGAVLKKLGLKTTVYIPDREEGHGLTEEGINQLKTEDVTLIITSDCGISSVEAVEIARKLKIDVVITDHHEVPKIIPKAKSILNPHQKGCTYPFKELAGVGVAFKLVQALSHTFKSELPDSFMKWMLDLVALGTICDIVPLIDENRLFAKFGLVVLNKTRKIGLLELYKVSEIELGKIDTYAISYIIGPRLNAPGRLDHASASFYLLTTKNHQRARELAITLDTNNKTRQQLLKRTLEEARQEIEKNKLHKNKLILLGSKDWSNGIIGLIAGKLKDKYSRPILVLSMGKAESRGSARSIDSFHITEILSACSDCLIKFGGHKRAAGFVVSNDKINELKEKLISLAEQRLVEKDLKPNLNIDTKINLFEIDWDLWEQLEKFEPTGFGNKAPVFLAENIKVDSLRLVGKQANHLKIRLSGFDGIFFGGGDLISQIKPDDLVDAVFQIAVDEWKSERKLQLKIMDLKKVD